MDTILKSRLVKSEEGMTTLLSVLIIAAAVLIIASNLAIYGQEELDISLSANYGRDAVYNAESCAHEGLRRLQITPFYLADDLPVALDGGFCTISITGTSSNKLLVAKAEVNNYYREIKVDIDTSSSSLIINNWNEY